MVNDTASPPANRAGARDDPFAQPRLGQPQTDFYRREGYLKYERNVLRPSEFDALKEHFEGKLSRLPSQVRPEAMDVPYFSDPALFHWLFSRAVLDLVEPLLGPDIALFSSHFICKPGGHGKRVPWHEDFFYWKGADPDGAMLAPQEVVTLWLAIDPSTKLNGCMNVIPRTHGDNPGEYEPVDPQTNVFDRELRRFQIDESRKVALELSPNQASLHDGRLIHGSDANTSSRRRCGYTMRYISTRVKFRHERHPWHQIYLARGQDRAGNQYADPNRAYPELARYREVSKKTGH